MGRHRPQCGRSRDRAPRSPKGRSGLMWQAPYTTCPGVWPAGRGSLSCCPSRHWTSWFTARARHDIPLRVAAPLVLLSVPDWPRMAARLGGKAESYLVICCQSAVASRGRNGLGMFPQLEHHFPGVRMPADVTGCLSIARRSVARGLRYFPRSEAVCARPAGLEPATRCLEGSCSIRLSYGRPAQHCACQRSHVGHKQVRCVSRRQIRLTRP